MRLTCLVGATGKVNTRVLLHALEYQPSLLIDCHNVANPHSLFPFVQYEKFAGVFVVPAESLYRFRAALRILPKIADGVGAKCIVITTFTGLFDFDNEEESNAVIEHCWELIRQAAASYEVVVGLKAATYEALARSHGAELVQI